MDNRLKCKLKMGSTEQIPDGWIRKESRSRPNKFYYFNTKSGKTQWEPPTIKEKKTQPRDDATTKSSKIAASFKGNTTYQSRLKISDGSKDVFQSIENKDLLQNHDAVHVFHSSFGIGDTKETTVPAEEMMDWEPLEPVYIIPDTNVFLDSLASIELIIEKDLKHSIFIPFVVLQELDKLKRRTNEGLVRSKSSRAIKYIHVQLKAKNPRLQSQKATEDNAHIINVTSPDDKILNCCLQLKDQSKEVILVTNDINLLNKSLLSGIEAITSKQCLEKF